MDLLIRRVIHRQQVWSLDCGLQLNSLWNALEVDIESHFHRMHPRDTILSRSPLSSCVETARHPVRKCRLTFSLSLEMAPHWPFHHLTLALTNPPNSSIQS